MNRALKALGKCLVIVTGVGYGVIKAMDSLADDIPPQPASTNIEKETPNRWEEIDRRLLRIEKTLEALKEPMQPTQPKEQFVTRAELDAILNQRFEVQNRSVQSLRSMIARTDELLEQVIENIESASLTAR